MAVLYLACHPQGPSFLFYYPVVDVVGILRRGGRGREKAILEVGNLGSRMGGRTSLSIAPAGGGRGHRDSDDKMDDRLGNNRNVWGICPHLTSCAESSRKCLSR